MARPAVWQGELGALGVLVIGMVNLLVSFYLAMWIGLTACGVNFSQRRQLLTAVLRHLWHQPREFFLPPKPADLHESLNGEHVA